MKRYRYISLTFQSRQRNASETIKHMFMMRIESFLKRDFF
jgi:hypothetical protein